MAGLSPDDLLTVEALSSECLFRQVVGRPSVDQSLCTPGGQPTGFSFLGRDFLRNLRALFTRDRLTVFRAVIALLTLPTLFLVAPALAQTPMSREVPTPSAGAEAAIAAGAGSQSSVAGAPRGSSASTIFAATAGITASKEGAVQRRFDGFGFDDNETENGTRFIPPDPSGAAGKSRLIAVVNTMIESRDKKGKLKWRDSLRDFFAPLSPTTFTFDPKVIYDQYEDRFVVVTLEFRIGAASMDSGNISRILLAVSKTGNPKTPTASDWRYHAINAKTTIFSSFDGFADYPGFEVDEEAIYVTANMFTLVPFGFFGGNRLWIVDKGTTGGFYDGGAAVDTVHDPSGATGFFTGTTMPAHVFDDEDSDKDSDSHEEPSGVGGPGSTLGTFLVLYSGLTFGGPGAPEALQVITVDDPLGNVGGPFFSGELVVLPDIEDVGGSFGFPPLPDAPQSDGAGGVSPFPIEVNDRRALDAVWRNNQLYVTATIIPNSGIDTGDTTAHWFQLDTSAGPGSLVSVNGGNIGGEDIAAGTFTFFPSVAVNKKNEVMFGFSASAPTTFAGAYAAGRKPKDAAGTVRATVTVRAGVGPYKRFFGGTRNRWGDYSGISVDPNDGKKFWVFNEFADAPGTPTTGSFGFEDGRWGTAWARVKVK